MNARRAILVAVCLVALVLGTGVASGQVAGSIVGWGRNNYGQCNVPEPNTSYVGVATGWVHSLGVKYDGTIVAWGRNDEGQCDVPVPNADFVAVAAGGAARWIGFPPDGWLTVQMGHSLGLKSDGAVVAWGSNYYGQCDVPEPNADFAAIASGPEHCLGLRSDGTVVAWGDDDYCDIPEPNAEFVAIAADGGLGWGPGSTFGHSLGLRSDGTIVAWGSNGSGQCDVPAPNADFVAIAAGGAHSVGLKSDGTIVAWGSNSRGQCNVPAPNTNFVTAAAGSEHSLGLKLGGTVVAWGRNNDGQCLAPEPNAGFVAVAASRSHSLGLRGGPVGGQPEIALSDTLLAFGPVDTGIAASDTVIVTNGGDGWLWVEGISIDHDDFSADPVSFWVNPGGGREVAVVFCPSSAGTITATLTIVSNDPNHETVEVALEGEGVLAGQIAISDTVVAFGEVCVGWPAAETVLVSNTGTGWLTVLEISADHADFSANPTTFALPPGDSRSVEVDFTPSSVGPITGTLTILSDDPEHPAVEIALEGEGTGSVQIAVSDTLLVFGQVCVGAATLRNFVVTSEGLCPLIVSDISTDNGDFSVGITGFTLPPGDPRQVCVEFAPSSVGLITGTLTITANDPDHPTLEITLEGEGLEGGRIAASDTLLSFGSVIIGVARWDHLRVTNVGCDLLTVSDISIDHEDFSASITSFSLEPEDSQEVAVGFAPSTSGPITATMTILSDDPDDPELAILLEGEGLVPPEIAVSPDSLYADLPVGETETQYITIENAGGSELVWSARAVDHAGARGARFADLTGVEILWDQRHGQDTWTHTIVVDQLESRGASVTESYARISGVLLGGYDVVWITDCSGNSWHDWWYTEVQALAAWVALGGSLLLEGENDPSVAVFNDILAALGAGIEYSAFPGRYGPTMNIHPHSTTTGVDSVYLWSPEAHLATVAYPALRLIDDRDGVPNSACSEVGFGRVVTMAGDLTNNFHLWYGNTGIFANQVFDWLARGSACTWLSCEPSSGTVEGGGSVDVGVTFDATELIGGDYLADVQVWSSDLDDPVVSVAACLHVTGVPDIAVSETFLSFGEVEVGAAAVETFLVWNEGTDLLTVSGASSDHADFSVDPVSFTLPPEESQAVLVEFAPSAEGLITGTLTILSDDPDEGTVLVALEGTGTFATPVEYSLYATATESGTVMLRWTVPSLTGVDGFNVYRATSQDGPFARANDDVIVPSTPGSFEDSDVWPGTTFCYELRVVLTDGSEDVAGTQLACVTTGGELATRLHPAYPNPLTSRTNVQFDVRSHAGPVVLAVYSIRGRIVRRLASGPFDRGRHVVTWDGRDERGMAVSAGVYFVRLETGGEVRTRKVAVVR